MNRQYPLVTIITPSYNQGRFIEQTIQSVLNQNYPNLEYIVVDGGSTDNTLEILSKYEGKLSWVSERDNGQSDAINKGFKMANGEIVAWLNSDDTYENGAIQKAVNYFLSNAEFVLVYGEGDIIDEKGNKVKRFEATQAFDLWTLIHVWDYIMQPTTFFKREALIEVGYLNEDLHWCMDWDLWIKLGQRYNVGYIPYVLANSREYAETKTSTGGWKRLKEITGIMRKYGNMKYPYGMFLYGASTIYGKMVGIPIMEIASRYLLATVHRTIFKRLPRKYPDNWIGEKLASCFPATKSEVTLKGKVLFPETLPLTIIGKVNGELVAQVTIGELGNFEITFPISNSKRLLNYVYIEASKYVVPNKISNGTTDSRRLSIIIDEFN